jgi:hypothetical protein
MLEKDICIPFVNMIKRLEHLAKKPFVWFHVVNEFDKKRNSYAHNFHLAKMGRVSGVADYIFLWKDGCLCLEFKTQKGRQSDSQKKFEQNCKDRGIPYYLARSVEEGFRVLEKEGLFEEGKIIF